MNEFSYVKKVISEEASTLAKIPSMLNEHCIGNIIEAIASSGGKIITTGCGTSAAVAKKIAHTLCCIEKPAFFLTPSDALHGALGVVEDTDLIIMVSKGGNTQELTQMIAPCKEKGAKIIGVTENAESTIAKEANIPLIIKVEKEPCPFNMLATASSLAVISVFDAISITIMEKSNYTKEKFAIIHPSGDVGNRLINETKTMGNIKNDSHVEIV